MPDFGAEGEDRNRDCETGEGRGVRGHGNRGYSFAAEYHALSGGEFVPRFPAPDFGGVSGDGDNESQDARM